VGRARDLIGIASVVAYLVVVAVIQATGQPDWQSLAASPDQIADGQLWLLLSSGLVIDGLPWLQLTVLAIVMALAYVRVGAARLWAAGLVAHVGSALLAYAGVGVLTLLNVDIGDTASDPDYGISVLLAAELGVIAVSGGRRTALLVGILGVAGFGIGLADANALANVEHLLGFGLGASTILLLDRWRPRALRPTAPSRADA
jgi:hypothetical protein